MLENGLLRMLGGATGQIEVQIALLGQLSRITSEILVVVTWVQLLGKQWWMALTNSISGHIQSLWIQAGWDIRY